MDDSVVRCLLHGDSTVGKTTLCIRHCSGVFPEAYIPTVFDGSKNLVVDAKPLTLLYVEPTRGGEMEDLLRVWPLTYVFSDVCLMCFSLVSPRSYENIMKEYYVHYNCWRFDMPIIVVGMKQDLVDNAEALRTLKDRNEVPLTTADGVHLAETINAVCYLECSSLTGEGVERVFQEACRAAGSGKEEKQLRCAVV